MGETGSLKNVVIPSPMDDGLHYPTYSRVVEHTLRGTPEFNARDFYVENDGRTETVHLRKKAIDIFSLLNNFEFGISEVKKNPARIVVNGGEFEHPEFSFTVGTIDGDGTEVTIPGGTASNPNYVYLEYVHRESVSIGTTALSSKPTHESGISRFVLYRCYQKNGSVFFPQKGWIGRFLIMGAAYSGA